MIISSNGRNYYASNERIHWANDKCIGNLTQFALTIKFTHDFLHTHVFLHT